MTSRKPGVIISGTAQRALLLLIAILLGILISIATANAAVRIEKSPYQSVQKKKNHDYSCRALMQKHRSSSNTVVKIKNRRPKWR